MHGMPDRKLTLFDSVCLIVGIMIGVGIYQMAPDVARGVGGWAGVMGIWLLGGLLSACGALGYAELASAYPEAGGDYVYLNRAFGPWAGFLFGWIQLVIVRPGDIAVMAFAFATYARTIVDPGWAWIVPVYAVGSVAVLTAINVAGVRAGKGTQNALTVVKAVGLLAVVGVAAFAPPTAGLPAAVPDPIPAGLALIFVLFTFGGWNEMVYVAAEVRDPRRNIIRALLLGTAAVTILYLLLNAAFLHTLGYAGLAASPAVATDSVAAVFPRTGARLVSALICLSALGAVNGLILTGARISFAVGRDHPLFAPLGHWNQRTGTPARALLLQGAITCTLIVLLGSFINTIVYTAPAVYSFYFATSIAVIVLRHRDPHAPRPYRVFAFPAPTLVFCATCLFLLHSAITYKPHIALAALGLLLAGIPVYWFSRSRGRTVNSKQ
jgi:basic amino acid/polyamine antiporter, APA family